MRFSSEPAGASEAAAALQSGTTGGAGGAANSGGARGRGRASLPGWASSSAGPGGRAGTSVPDSIGRGRRPWRLSERASVRVVGGCGGGLGASGAVCATGVASVRLTTAAVAMVGSGLSSASSAGVDMPDEVAEGCADTTVEACADGEAVEASAVWLETASEESLVVARV